MAYDDDVEDPRAASPGGRSDENGMEIEAGEDELIVGDGDQLEEEGAEEDAEEGAGAQDFSLLASSASSSSSPAFSKKGVASQSLRKGEKDFESHGTRAQAGALEESRRVMESVLSYTRVHPPAQRSKGWCFPEHLRRVEEGSVGDAEWERAAAAKRREIHAADMVVVMEIEKGTTMKSVGSSIPGLPKDDPGRGKTWLLPEEALFCLDRGSLDLWWPLVGLERIFPAKGDDDVAASQERDEEDEYELGVPLGLEGAYSLLIGKEGERGKTTLQRYQVYAHLKRNGYNLLRASPLPSPREPLSSLSVSKPSDPPLTIWQWLFSLLHFSSGNHASEHLPYGPLVHRGLYRSYRDIYRQLDLVPRHQPQQTAAVLLENATTQEPFRVFYQLWKSSSHPWSRTRQPPPDFYLVVVDAQESSVPTLEEISALLETASWSPPASAPSAAGPPHKLYGRLKHGYRSVLVAIVDHGIVNYMRFAEGAFGQEPLWHRFDSGDGPRRSKGGGGGAARGGRHRNRGRR